MKGWQGWVAMIIAVAAIVAMVALARGEPQRGEPTPPPAAAVTTLG